MGIGAYDEFKEHLNKIRSGELVLIPNPLERVDEVYNLLPARYTLISGATGSGKTSFMDFSFVLSPFMYLQKTNADIHFEILYFSLERKILFKKFKWISWLMYKLENEIYSAEFLLGYTKTKPSSDILTKIEQYKDTVLDQLMEHVSIYDGKLSASKLIQIIKNKAKSLGVLYESDDDTVFKDGVPIATFDHTNIRTTKHKGNEVFIDLEHNGTKFEMVQNSRRYFQNHKKTLVFILVDGINLLGDKETLDEVSKILADSRDVYNFSPVVVTQQNRAQANTDRLKLHGESMGPQMEDIYKSSQMAFDSDLVLSLFDPYYFKAYDSKGMVGGYQIVVGGTMAPQGFSRFRSLHILKNSFGFSGKRYGMKFLGETGDFLTLPLPDKEPERLNQIYIDIARGR